jgi:ferredoxin
MAKIIHYRNKCIGCGICYEIDPQVWRMSTKDGRATLVNGINKKDIHIREVTVPAKHVAQRAAQACPVRVIKVVD